MRATGKLPEGEYKRKLASSINYRDGAFQNLSQTPMKAEGVSYWRMMRHFFSKHPHTSPSRSIEAIRTDLGMLGDKHPVIVWFGHSSYFIRINEQTFLIDPVFSGHASPFSFMVKAFRGTNEYGVADMPHIDYLILTHDHYDHLDYETITALNEKVGRVICSLGVKAHLEYWGYRPGLITELDWWDELPLQKQLSLTAAPARHFSGRTLKRGQSLWSSFILKSASYNIFLGGDSGYDAHFKQIGEKFGPFDIAILEAGQYNSMWPYIHMMPEETVQAAIDLRAKCLMPVHWGKFRLSTHPWNEPVKRVVEKARQLSIDVAVPRIGEPLYLDGNYQSVPWWEKY
jgi:L-ascorbate metabolism protein UlaG (beta-lactamase superfamily)